MTPSELESLTKQAKAGERAALETLLISFANELSIHIASRIPAKFRATLGVEDIVQEAYLQAFSHVDKLRAGSLTAFKAWLKAIADIALLRMIRQQGRQKRGGQFRQVRGAVDSKTGSVVEIIDKLPADIATASHVVATREAVDALRVAIAGLPEQQRQAILLYVLEGLSLEDTAYKLGCTKGAARALVYRGKQSLAAAMGRASSWLVQE